jgi:hypothetical protein
MDNKQLKEKIIYWLFGEIRFDTRWKILMWSIQTIAILALFYFVVISDEFKDNKTVKEVKPLLDALKAGNYYLTKDPRCAANFSQLTILQNFTMPNPYPTPIPKP